MKGCSNICTPSYMSNKPALPPHLLKTVPPPPYLQGQPLVANYTPYCYQPLSQIASQSPAVPPRTNPNMVIGMATANTSDTRQPFFTTNNASKTKNVVQESGARLRILTFNCKNVVISKIALQEFMNALEQIFYFCKNIGCLTVTYTDLVKSHNI